MIVRLGVAALVVAVWLPTGAAAGVGHAAASTAGAHRYAAARSHPRRDPYYPAVGVTSVDALHYGLALTWDGADRLLTGRATVLFRATRNESRVALDLGHPLHVSQVRLDGRPVTWTHRGHVLRMRTGEVRRNSRHTLVIRYAGHPRPVVPPTRRGDLRTTGWTTLKDGEAWSVQEPYGAFTWYPVNDHPSDKAFYDIALTTKPAWRGITSGALELNQVVNGQRTMRWRLGSPAASYLIALDIGPYRAHHHTGPHGLPITYWARPQDKPELKDLRRTPADLRWLEARLGRYPFAELGVVVSPTDTAEETQTMVTMGADVLLFDDSGALTHELAHQWYGDEVTPDNWPDLWMNESFAYYLQLRWEAARGIESMAASRRYLDSHDQGFRRHDGPPGRYFRNDFASSSVYDCGALMLDRLHAMLPAPVFARVLREWPRLHRWGSVNRSLWVGYLDRVTGRNLAGFVHRWLDSPTTPA